MGVFGPPDVERLVAKRNVTGLIKALRDKRLALSRSSPPRELGVTHWSSRLLARYLRREGITVSHVFVADLWREERLRP